MNNASNRMHAMTLCATARTVARVEIWSSCNGCASPVITGDDGDDATERARLEGEQNEIHIRQRPGKLIEIITRLDGHILHKSPKITTPACRGIRHYRECKKSPPPSR